MHQPHRIQELIDQLASEATDPSDDLLQAELEDTEKCFAFILLGMMFASEGARKAGWPHEAGFPSKEK